MGERPDSVSDRIDQSSTRRLVLRKVGSAGTIGIAGIVAGVGTRPAQAEHLDDPPEMIERATEYSRRYEDCAAYDDYEHLVRGHSVELTDDAGTIGVGGITAVISYLAGAGGPIAAAAGGLAAAAVSVYSEEETISFGAREYDRSYLGAHTQAFTSGVIAAEWEPTAHRTVSTSVWPTHEYY
jgi:hypothetical protein